MPRRNHPPVRKRKATHQSTEPQAPPSYKPAASVPASDDVAISPFLSPRKADISPPPSCRICAQPMPPKWPHPQHAQCWKQTNPTTHTEENK